MLDEALRSAAIASYFPDNFRNCLIGNGEHVQQFKILWDPK